MYLELHRLGLEIFEIEKFTLFINLKSFVTVILNVLTSFFLFLFFSFLFFFLFLKNYLVLFFAFTTRKDLSIISLVNLSNFCFVTRFVPISELFYTG